MFLKVKESNSKEKMILLNLDLVQKFEASGIDTVAHYSNGNLVRLSHTIDEIEGKLLPQNKKTKND